jgi:hypothetical protein
MIVISSSNGELLKLYQNEWELSELCSNEERSQDLLRFLGEQLRSARLLVVEAGIGADGKRIKRTRTVKADGIREARKLLSEFQTEVKTGSYITP